MLHNEHTYTHTVSTGTFRLELIGGYRRGKELTSDVDFVCTFEK
jgi:DNA polymerase/3'-5' exonuclease PolX